MTISDGRTYGMELVFSRIQDGRPILTTFDKTAKLRLKPGTLVQTATTGVCRLRRTKNRVTSD